MYGKRSSLDRRAGKQRKAVLAKFAHPHLGKDSEAVLESIAKFPIVG
jgi:hypothetical protein